MTGPIGRDKPLPGLPSTPPWSPDFQPLPAIRPHTPIELTMRPASRRSAETARPQLTGFLPGPAAHETDSGVTLIPTPSPNERALLDARGTRIDPRAAQALEDIREAQKAHYQDLTTMPRAAGNALQRLLHMPRAAAVVPEAISLAVIAGCVFGLTRTGGQVLGFDKAMDDLQHSTLNEAGKQALATLAGITMGGAFAGVGVLLAQVFAAPLFTGLFRAATAPVIGNYKFEPVPPEAVVPDPSPYVGDGSLKTMTHGLRERQVAWTGGQREQVAARQRNHGLDNWFSTNAVLAAFMVFHGLRITLTGTSGTAVEEVFKTGLASGLAGGLGQLGITLNKMWDRMPVRVDQDEEGRGTVERRPVFHARPNDPAFGDTAQRSLPPALARAKDRLQADLATAFKNFHDNRSWRELAPFTALQAGLHGVSVFKATIAVIALNAFAAPAKATHPKDMSAMVIDVFSAYLSFYAALNVLFNDFPGFAVKRKRTTVDPLALPMEPAPSSPPALEAPMPAPGTSTAGDAIDHAV